jgi:dihydrofolate synthase/folylpolyglutamate synthase
MRTLLAALGDPQLGYPAIHVVGTNGKSTATRTIEALLLGEGLSTGATVSPHVGSWAERITVDGNEVDFEAAIGRVRPEAEAQGATQFETVCAAAFAEFAAHEIEVGVVEAGLGGRLDATNVVDARVVLLTNVGLEHTDVLGDTREQIAREKLAVANPGATVVLPDDEWRHLVAELDVRLGGAREAAEAFAGHPIETQVEVELPGRLERRGPDEVRDGAHTPEAVDWLLEQLEPREWTIVASILRDKDVEGMLDRLRRVGMRLVATCSSNPRALDERELAARAKACFDHVEAIADPARALERARALGPVLVTGSLYLLADLHASE